MTVRPAIPSDRAPLPLNDVGRIAQQVKEGEGWNKRGNPDRIRYFVLVNQQNFIPKLYFPNTVSVVGWTLVFSSDTKIRNENLTFETKSCFKFNCVFTLWEYNLNKNHKTSKCNLYPDFERGLSLPYTEDGRKNATLE